MSNFYVLINTLSINGGGSGYVLRKVSSYIVHENYSNTTYVSNV